MNELLIIGLLAVLLGAVTVRLLIPWRATSPVATRPVRTVEESLRTANHYKYFPQIRQALSRADTEYLLKNAPPRVARTALRERRGIARRFLEGLRDDFYNLARLGRTIAALSPEVSHRQETKRFFLTAQFEFLYMLVWLRLSVGMLPLHQLETLAGVVGRLAARIDEAMAEINALSAGQLAGKLNV
jgi:hypothetical protein